MYIDPSLLHSRILRSLDFVAPFSLEIQPHYKGWVPRQLCRQVQAFSPFCPYRTTSCGRSYSELPEVFLSSQRTKITTGRRPDPGFILRTAQSTPNALIIEQYYSTLTPFDVTSGYVPRQRLRGVLHIEASQTPILMESDARALILQAGDLVHPTRGTEMDSILSSSRTLTVST